VTSSPTLESSSAVFVIEMSAGHTMSVVCSANAPAVNGGVKGDGLAECRRQTRTVLGRRRAGPWFLGLRGIRDDKRADDRGDKHKRASPRSECDSHLYPFSSRDFGVFVFIREVSARSLRQAPRPLRTAVYRAAMSTAGVLISSPQTGVHALSDRLPSGHRTTPRATPYLPASEAASPARLH
jgi:hypothetical protein